MLIFNTFLRKINKQIKWTIKKKQTQILNIIYKTAIVSNISKK